MKRGGRRSGRPRFGGATFMVDFAETNLEFEKIFSVFLNSFLAASTAGNTVFMQTLEQNRPTVGEVDFAEQLHRQRRLWQRCRDCELQEELGVGCSQ